MEWGFNRWCRSREGQEKTRNTIRIAGFWGEAGWDRTNDPLLKRQMHRTQGKQIARFLVDLAELLDKERYGLV